MVANLVFWWFARYFAWDYRVLKTFARHYSTGEIIPEKLVESMQGARKMFAATELQRQVHICLKAKMNQQMTPLINFIFEKWSMLWLLVSLLSDFLCLNWPNAFWGAASPSKRYKFYCCRSEKTTYLLEACGGHTLADPIQSPSELWCRYIWNLTNL